MFATVNRTKELTGYDVTEELLGQAQAIIESYVGRLEVEVTKATDLELLARATAYQAAYMKNDTVRIFEQMAVSQISQFGASVTFRGNDLASPFVAPQAVMACQRLSWKRIRSVRIGSVYDVPTEPEQNRWFTE